MFHRVKAVAGLQDYVLSVQFTEGITKTYDIKPLFNRWKQFEVLSASPELYFEVQVDQGGYGIVWNDELDLSCDDLFEHGRTVHTPFDGLMSFAGATELWGLNESTLRKAIAYGKLRNGTDVCKFGKQWIP